MACKFHFVITDAIAPIEAYKPYIKRQRVLKDATLLFYNTGVLDSDISIWLESCLVRPRVGVPRNRSEDKTWGTNDGRLDGAKNGSRRHIQSPGKRVAHCSHAGPWANELLPGRQLEVNVSVHVHESDGTVGWPCSLSYPNGSTGKGEHSHKIRYSLIVRSLQGHGLILERVSCPEFIIGCLCRLPALGHFPLKESME